jgi:DNA repair protein RecO (recombination protein O)
MLHHTKGIVLSFIKYRETSIIVRIYTEKFGLQSYIVNSIRSPKSKGKIALYQPMTILDLVVYYKPSTNLNRISEIRCSKPFKSIPFNPIKTALTIFLSEVLGKSLKEENEDIPLFNYITDSIIQLDNIESDFENFHLSFLIELSGYLGFRPNSVNQLLAEVKRFKSIKDFDQNEILQCEKLLFRDNLEKVKLPYSLRRSILEILIFFYQIHFDHWGEVKSLPVLQEIMR